MGISMLVLASLATGYYGTLQEKTYTRYGPHWREGVFYTVSRVSTFQANHLLTFQSQHLFSLPTFLFLKSDIRRGLALLSNSPSELFSGINYSYLVLALNVVTQLLCTSSVNKLSSVRLITCQSVNQNINYPAEGVLSDDQPCIDGSESTQFVHQRMVVWKRLGQETGFRRCNGVPRDHFIYFVQFVWL